MIIVLPCLDGDYAKYVLTPTVCPFLSYLLKFKLVFEHLPRHPWSFVVVVVSVVEVKI